MAALTLRIYRKYIYKTCLTNKVLTKKKALVLIYLLSACIGKLLESESSASFLIKTVDKLTELISCAIDSKSYCKSHFTIGLAWADKYLLSYLLYLFYSLSK